MTWTAERIGIYALSHHEIDDNGCWNWQRQKEKGGYGKFRTAFNSKWYKAHREAYRHFYGSIPSGLHVLHKCDNPSCVNPSHLFLGTHLDNILDRVRKGRTRNNTPKLDFCRQGHPLIDSNRLGTLKKECKECHRRRQKYYRERNSHAIFV